LVCADETARRRAEQHFSTVVAAIEEGVVVVGSTGLVESVNPAAERILGIREHGAVGQPAVNAKLFDETGAPIPASSHPAEQTRLTGQPQNTRIVCITRSDGSRIWLSLSCRVLDSEDDTPCAVV